MLIIPSVSIGNGPQLALDLLIHTYSGTLKQTVNDEFLHPFAGPQDHPVSKPASGLATAAQLFELDDSQNHSLVQLRSAPLSGYSAKFAESLASLKHDEVILVFTANKAVSDLGKDPLVQCKASELPENLVDAGFAQHAAKTFPKAQVLLLYTHDGDNLADAYLLAESLVDVLNLERKEFIRPVSWNRLYGSEAPTLMEQGIYA